MRAHYHSINNKYALIKEICCQLRAANQKRELEVILLLSRAHHLKNGRIVRFFFLQIWKKLLNFKFFSVVSSILSFIFEVLLLIVKFNSAIVEFIFKLIVTKERDVSGDVVLITGAGAGIGREMALQYAELGATIICWDINEALNQETVDKVKTISRKSVFGYT